MKYITAGLLIGWLLMQQTMAASLPQQKLTEVLEQHQGEVIYLDFWASWCGPCRQSMPWMNQMQQKYQAQGFSVVSINVDADKSLADLFLQQNTVNFEVIFDPQGDVAQQYKIIGMPSSYLIGRDGKIKLSHVGFFNHQKSQYEQDIVKLLGAKDE